MESRETKADDERDALLSTAYKEHEFSATEEDTPYKNSIDGDEDDELDDAPSKSDSSDETRQFEDISETSSDSSFKKEEVREVNLQTCSVRDYIENTVGHILLRALTLIERERPEDPIKWLARFLLFHKDGTGEFLDPPPGHGTVKEKKLPERIKKNIWEDVEDLEIDAVNKLL